MGGQGYLVRFGFASSAMRAVPFLPHSVTERSYRRPLSPSGSGCRCHGSTASRPRNGLFRVRCTRCFRASAPSLLCDELRCHPGGGARVWLSRSSLRGFLGGCRSSFARKLPPVVCGSGTGLGLSRVRSLRHSLLIHPSTDVPLGLSFLMVSACLHTYVF